MLGLCGARKPTQMFCSLCWNCVQIWLRIISDISGFEMTFRAFVNLISHVTSCLELHEKEIQWACPMSIAVCFAYSLCVGSTLRCTQSIRYIWKQSQISKNAECWQYFQFTIYFNDRSLVLSLQSSFDLQLRPFSSHFLSHPVWYLTHIARVICSSWRSPLLEPSLH